MSRWSVVGGLVGDLRFEMTAIRKADRVVRANLVFACAALRRVWERLTVFDRKTIDGQTRVTVDGKVRVIIR